MDARFDTVADSPGTADRHVRMQRVRNMQVRTSAEQIACD